ncbi:uncharacterized protein LOC123518003 [Portunus trituberculatus]|uniref:uncharacterized protein LOC123518003 n=1 Tax=Portunus trituberculatus TaxID=210409 RepID=UPI001E1D1BB5|nr:uncharacterized protein LOC123518003 [Portunus trituberculatus]
MPRLSKKDKQRKEAWTMSMEAQRRKRQRVDLEATAPLAVTPHATPLLPPTVAAARSTPQPGTSQVQERKADEDKASLLTIREELLQTLQTNEDADSDEEFVILTKKRLKKLTSSHCSCPDPALEYTFKPKLFENAVTIRCTTCNFNNTSRPEFVEAGAHKKKISRANIVFIYLSIIEDTGFAGMRRMMGGLGMPLVGKFKYYRHLSYLCDKTHYNSKQAEIHSAIRRYYEENTSKKADADGVLKLDVSFDATWHTSKVGMSVMIEVHTSFIIDYEILSKYCHGCTLKKNQLKKKSVTEEEYNTWKTKHDAEGSCAINYDGPSGGMEVEAARRLFARSRDLKFEYENLVSDGDANSYKAVLAMNNGNGPYQHTQVTKIECINHVQKRMGTRLRKLREQEKIDTTTRTGSKIRRSLLGGRNKLTDNAIDKMQSFFGKHIRDNVGADYLTMKKAVMSSFHHIFSTDENPRHGLCKEGINSWCFYQKALAEGKKKEEIKHKKSLVVNLDQEAQKKIRQVYDALTTRHLGEMCPWTDTECQ